jgi:Family of unknown function (DUF5324)
MKTLTGKKSERTQLNEIGHTVSARAAEAGHKVHEEFDDIAPKVAAAASDALHAAVHTAAERSRPVRAEAASRGSAALAGLLGEVTPAQIKTMSDHASRRRGKTALILAAAGGAVLWVLWWKRSDPNMDIRLEEVSETDPEAVGDHGEDFTSPPPDLRPFPGARRDS